MPLFHNIPVLCEVWFLTSAHQESVYWNAWCMKYNPVDGKGCLGSHLIQSLAEGSTNVKVAPGSIRLSWVLRKNYVYGDCRVFLGTCSVLVLSWKSTNSSSRLFPWLWMLLVSIGTVAVASLAPQTAQTPLWELRCGSSNTVDEV